MREPEHGQRSTCAVCGTLIYFEVATVGTGVETIEVDSWWRHETHPADHHDAVPSDSITCPVCERTSWHPMDVAYGWCGNCRKITRRNDPAVRIFDDLASLGYITLVPPEEMEQRTRMALLMEQRLAFAVVPPEHFTRIVLAPPARPTRWGRWRQWLRSRLSARR